MREVEVPKWLKKLPLAPEFHPTDTEFADPIAYISKIEKEAGAFGICKVIPPLPRPSKKYVIHNMNKSLSKCPDLVSEVNVGSSSGGEVKKGLFTTRQQELGQCDKKVKGRGGSQTMGAKKQVWQSGEVYTLEQFEIKSKIFAKDKLGGVKDVSPAVIETMFWDASTEKPIFVEYANDVPGSGFGELEGSSRYLNRQSRPRRKRGTFIRFNVDNNSSKKDQVSRSSSTVHCNSLDNDVDVHNADASLKCSNSQSDVSENHASKNCSNNGEEMVGSSGWKLSKSAWNLQAIARSPGSLTRFMPDDIPGVTSPMIYIGMLFSWFAWHVEDHDLHSLNYLHVGSPKTWYAVPGDHASAFEEVIRLHAYGGSVGRLDALTLLGEKTTLLSPEVIVASGIPCCRLVQNPGEFVVTFPRAYHIGFSHGFNCGEAANFGTPFWLEVAKEAAVRRAVMNYLPMLSHQQLLYLLTMSFVSRVPRSLLLGVRNSRFRNRHKEERELTVKKAFVEDLLKENCLLSILLQKSCSRPVVVWDLERLPSSSKVSQFHNDDTIFPLSKDANRSDLYSEMNLFMDNANDLYADDADDMLSDYQVDSGSLPCVGCGILGFPFMAVVQPSEQAATALWAKDPDVIQNLGVSKSVDELSSAITVVAEDVVDDAMKSKAEILHDIKAVASSSTVRPRIFCLEHAIQTVDMLLPIGGSKVLGICHSDFNKIKAHAATVAEEIDIPFTYNEIPLEEASPEDLSLIDRAIGDEYTRDWTVRLHINLQHTVKMRKLDRNHSMEHALNVGGFFSEECSRKNNFKWQSRRLRSKRNSGSPSLDKSVENIQIKTVDEEPHAVQDGEDGKRDRVIIQCYSRKIKPRHSVSREILDKSMGSNKCSELRLADSTDPSKTSNEILENTCALAEDTGICFPPSLSTEISQNRDTVILLSENLSNNSSALGGVGLLTETASVAESNDMQTGPEVNAISGSQCSEKSTEVEVSEESCCTPDIADSTTSASSLDASESSRENVVSGEVDSDDCGEDPCQMSSEDDVAKDASEPSNLGTDDADNDSLAGETLENKIESIVDDEQGVRGTQPKSTAASGKRRRREVDILEEDRQHGLSNFTRSPCEGLRPRSKANAPENANGEEEPQPVLKNATIAKKPKKDKAVSVPIKKKGRHKCDVSGCKMSFETKGELALHARNRCPVEGCGKKFSSHRYAITHQRVHDENRPLKCTWEGCEMTFKWGWARTEHMRVHTGERPYKCMEGCELTFRFVSDFSRHRRKTGHYV